VLRPTERQPSAPGLVLEVGRGRVLAGYLGERAFGDRLVRCRDRGAPLPHSEPSPASPQSVRCDRADHEVQGAEQQAQADVEPAYARRDGEAS